MPNGEAPTPADTQAGERCARCVRLKIACTYQSAPRRGRKPKCVFLRSSTDVFSPFLAADPSAAGLPLRLVLQQHHRLHLPRPLRLYPSTTTRWLPSRPPQLQLDKAPHPIFSTVLFLRHPPPSPPPPQYHWLHLRGHRPQLSPLSSATPLSKTITFPPRLRNKTSVSILQRGRHILLPHTSLQRSPDLRTRITHPPRSLHILPAVFREEKASWRTTRRYR